tara:strand:+ start:1782 stop:2270 length:489 start_codon:yes stop_codon:yes gene_type:complete
MLVDFDILTDSSRVWVYAAEHKLTNTQQRCLIDLLSDHIDGWHAHQLPLRGGVTIFEDHFIVIALDESQNAASGCAIDTLQNKIQQAEKKLKISLMNRMNIFCIINNIIECISIDHLFDRDISKEILFYDLTIQRKGELKDWLKPIKDGWCNRFLSQDIAID